MALAGAVVAGAFLTTTPTRALALGIVGQPAPELSVTTWFNLPPRQANLELADLRGKVVYLFFFQSWCPGCHSHGFPTMKTVLEHYREDERVVFVAVQTVFEGFWANDADAAYESVAKFDLDIPVGHDAGTGERGSTTMRRYRSGGTPWTVIIDPAGIVQFNGFQITAEHAIQGIDTILARQ